MVSLEGAKTESALTSASSEVSTGYEYEMDKGIDANVCNNRSYICDDGSGRRCDGREEELR